MEAVIWIETLSRHRDVVARHRCVGPEVRIGRAYDNDVVIDDPYVAPYHLRIARDAAGHLVAEDLNSLNGLFIDRQSARQAQVTLDGDRVIRIGATTLRVRDSRQTVPPERTLLIAARLWPRLAAMAVAIVVAYLVDHWLSETTEPKPSRYLAILLVLPLWAIGWSGAWAIVSRIFTGQARFDRHLQIGLSGMLAYWLWGAAATMLGFGLAWPFLAAYQDIGLWALAGAVVFCHLRALGPARLWLKAAASGALAALAIALVLTTRSDAEFRTDDQRLLQNFLPPVFRLAEVKDETAFFGQVARLKSKLDRDRLEAVPSPSFGAGLLSDDDD